MALPHLPKFDSKDDTYKAWPRDEYPWAQQRAVFTIPLGELKKGGFLKWDEEDWDFPKYTEEQHKRLIDLFEQTYYWREICYTPPLRWKMELLAWLRTNMPKYVKMYEAIDKQGLNIYQDEDEYYKSRNVHSEYPQTMLSGNEDYATDGTDFEHEKIREGSPVEKLNQFETDFQTIDKLIIDKLDIFFRSSLSANVNSFN